MGSIIGKAHTKANTISRVDPDDETFEDWMYGERHLGDIIHGSNKSTTVNIKRTGASD